MSKKLANHRPTGVFSPLRTSAPERLRRGVGQNHALATGEKEREREGREREREKERERGERE